MHIYIPPDSQLLQDYKKFAQRIGLIGATNLFIGLSGIILLPILTKTMPIEEYGTYVQVTVTIGLVPSIVMLGLPYTMVRYLAAAKSKEDVQEGYYSILGITVITSGVTSIIIFLLAGPIANALFDGHFEVTQILAAIVFLECMNGLQFNYFRTFQHIKRYSALTFSKTLVQLTLVGAFVLLDHGIFGAMIGLLITDLILFAIMGILIVSEIDVVFPKFKNLREYLSFGLPTVPGNVSSWVVNSSDRYVIALFLGAAYVGYYSPGYTLGNTISMFIAPLSFMLPAVLSKYYDEGDLGTVARPLYPAGPRHAGRAQGHPARILSLRLALRHLHLGVQHRWHAGQPAHRPACPRRHANGQALARPTQGTGAGRPKWSNLIPVLFTTTSTA